MVATIQGRFYADFANPGPAVKRVTDTQQEFNKDFR